MDNLKKLKKQNYQFKIRIKSLNNNVKQDKYKNEGYDDVESEDYGDQFGGKQSNNKSKKFTTRC